MKRHMFSTIIVASCISLAASAIFATTESPKDPLLNGSTESVVYLYRPKAFAGGGVKYDISVDGSIVAQLKNCSFISLKLIPGSYTISTQAHPSVSANPAPIEITVNEGERNFYLLDITGTSSFTFIGQLTTGTSSAKAGWRKSSETDAIPFIKKCKQVASAGINGKS